MKYNIFRFNTSLAKEIIQEILNEHLKDKDYSGIEAETYSRTIANEIKAKLKGIVNNIIYIKTILYIILML